jgi:type IV pilus assembly protein PilV
MAGNRAGFTLIEVLFAMTVFTIGVLAVAALQGTGLRAAAQAKALNEGQSAARTMVEQLMALPHDHPRLSDRNGDGAAGLMEKGEEADHLLIPPNQEKMKLSWNIAPDWPRPGVTTIRVVAHWSERGRERRTALEFERTRLF